MVQLALTVEILAQIHKCMFFCVILQSFPKKYLFGCNFTAHLWKQDKMALVSTQQGRRHLDLEYKLFLYNPSPLKASQMQPNRLVAQDLTAVKSSFSLLFSSAICTVTFFFWKSITCPAECSKRGLQVTFPIIILSDTEELLKSYTLSRSQEGTAA